MKTRLTLWALMCALLAPGAWAQGKTAGGLAGDWQGALAAGGTTLRLVMHFTAKPDGTLGGTLDSLDQGANGIPLGQITDTNGLVHVAVPSVGGTFDGKRSADGKQIVGTWAQGAAPLPLTLARLAPGQAPAAAPTAPPVAAPTFGPTVDSGTFRLSIQDNPVGTDTWTADADGSSDGTAQVTLGPKHVTLHTQTQIKNGTLTQVVTDGGAALGRLTLSVNGDSSAVVVTQAGKTVTIPQKLPARVFAFGNFAPHLLAPLIRAYDTSKGGPQVFTLAFIDGVAPGGVPTAPGTLSRDSARTVTIGGKLVTVTRYSLTLAGGAGNLDVQISADDKGRVLMWNVPAQKYVAVRDGYGALLVSQQPTDPTLSQPTYKVTTDRNVRVPLRDGVTLAADVSRPDAPGKFPVILQRTPYGRDKAMEATFWAKRGYVFVAQDVRGKGDSGGEWRPFVKEAQDGDDSINWCARQPWSSGNVGMIGASYLGFVQWAAARERNPHLKCLIPIVSPPDPFFNIPYAFGAFLLYGSAWWSGIVEGHGMNPIPKFPTVDAFKTLPLADVDKSLFGHHIAFFQEWLQHPTDDAYWQQGSFDDSLTNIGPLPALHISGWFDGDGIGTKRNYAAMVASGHANQRLVYGPWQHGVDAATRVGELDFGPTALRDLDTLYLRWFDHWLKGVSNGVEREQPVDAFLMGANQWRSFSAWPPKEAVRQKWYLRAGGGLAPQTPASGEAADHYAYDPADPWVSPNLAASLQSGHDIDTLDISGAEKTPKVLVYSSAPLTQDVAVAGPISLHLTASTSAKDTDWVAVLTDVRPDGKSLALCEGVVRARYRHSYSQPALLQPGEITGYDIDLWALGNVFQKGHQIRVVVTSSDFPAFDRNLNTGGDTAHGTAMETARQTVFHDPARPSYLILPVLPH